MYFEFAVDNKRKLTFEMVKPSLHPQSVLATLVIPTLFSLAPFYAHCFRLVLVPEYLGLLEC